ncbi:MAG TPA: histidinol dehydrogenase [Gemmatimonadaceae bacterium]
MTARTKTSVLRTFGACEELSSMQRRTLFERGTSNDAVVRERTRQILGKVRSGGDDALRTMGLAYDGVTLSSLEVPRSECDAALEGLDAGLRRVMERSAANIRRVHEAFRPDLQEVETEPGILVGRRPDPLGRVGVYAPGGRASYPSSVLMGAIPARVAGVAQVILCSPPQRESGRPANVVLAAAALAEVDRVFAVGGAGAIGAMAHGTTTIPRVDRIVGPGNAYVAEAKIQVSSMVGIDSPAGPSELFVLADDSSNADVIARELLAQAEHDPLAAVVAVTSTRAHALEIQQEIERLLPLQPRRDISGAALEGRGAVLWSESLDARIEFANMYAPEHLLLLGETTDVVLARLRNAGTVFVGEFASVAFGDYMTGANHVLPTGGLARAYSGLSTLDFVRWTTYQRVTRRAAARMSFDVAAFAEAEGLGGHAMAARAWAVEKVP